jgi:hypothetical protein
MIVFELPGDVIMVILSSWIDMKTLAKSDSALCTSELRTRFLELIGNESFVADTMCTDPCVQQLQWLTQRRIKVRNWIVNRDAADPCFPDSLKFTAGPHVCSLQLRNQSPPGLAKVFLTLAAACSSLQMLKMENCRCGEATMLGSSAQQSLQQLIILNCEGCCWASYAPLPCLEKLHVKLLCETVVIPSITSLLTAAPNLTDRRADQLRRGNPEAVSESGIVRRGAQYGQFCAEQVAGTNKSIIYRPCVGRTRRTAAQPAAHRCAIRCVNAALTT